MKGKRVYLIGIFRARVLFPELKRQILLQDKLHGASVILIEDHGSGTSVYQQLRTENFGKLRPVKPLKDKKTRMENQTAAIENGMVFLPREAPWLADLLHELAVFPNGRHDDQVDSISQALDHIYSRNPGQEWMAIAEAHHAEKALLVARNAR